ncbi:MAG: 3-deoxy-manno-octulosonate cytidylyltransferase [Planctomycetota bacterium]
MKILAVIPARYGSTRFPGKVLAKDTGKFLVQHTYEQACSASLLNKVIIATDSEKVAKAAQSFGAEWVMTSAEHQSGTDRIAEAVADIEADIIVNIQADEPDIDPENINHVAKLLVDNPDYQMATLATEFKTEEQVANPNIVKVVVGCKSQALYFSRFPIPYDRNSSGIGDPGQHLWHLGIYSYRKGFLKVITRLPQTILEKTEKLEQLRAIENGYPILVGKIKHRCEGIDTPGQYAEFVSDYLSKTKKL